MTYVINIEYKVATIIVCAVSAPLIWQVPDLLLFWDDPPEFLIGGSDGGWW